jgi:hypothetical protein
VLTSLLLACVMLACVMLAIDAFLSDRVTLLSRFSILAPIVGAFFVDLMNLAVLTFFLIPGLVVGR